MQGQDTRRTKYDARSWGVTCLQCGEHFEAARSDATFCSARCRVSYSREPARKQAALEALEAMARQVSEISRKYKHSQEVLEAVTKLQKAIGGSLNWFENE